MRKWILVTIVLLLALAGIYWFIPGELKVVQITPVHCPAPAAFRVMATEAGWRTWWPANEPLQFRNNKYTLTKTLHHTLQVQIQHTGLPVNSTINLLPLPHDSCAIQWTCTITSGMNPFTRIQRYRQVLDIKNNMAGILNHFRLWAQQKEKLYGIPLRETSYKDTILIATKTTTSVYPGVKDIYPMINALKKYSTIENAKQTSYPLLNITPLDTGKFQVMAALPVDKPLPDKGPFFQRKMIPAKFLFTSVQGGDSAIQHTFRQLQFYITDYRRTTMAIPFQVLVTDRSTEPDSSKWVTHIYVPVF